MTESSVTSPAQGVRAATLDDVETLARIAAEGFYDDPVLSWLFPDPSTRLEHLRTVFRGLAVDMLPDRGAIYLLDDACASFWRDPSFEHGRTAADRARENDDSAAGAESESPFPDDALVRMEILGEAMMTAHPHEPHWYLNVISTLPARQGQGLGARVLEPVLSTCDAEGTPAYLESSNPRNMTLYRRHGFVDLDEIPLPDGPSLYAMWREPRR